MSKHTPGPWKVFGIKSRHGDYTISTFNAYGPQRHIAYAAWASDQGLADAHLIAAAPDLLEACVQAAIQFRFYEQQHLAKGTPDGDAKALRNHEMAKICETAIAKATGAPQ